jgi:hypothetical protein
MFKKKKKDREVLNVGVTEADVTPREKEKSGDKAAVPELTEAQKQLMELYKGLLEEVGDVFTPTDAANTPESVFKSELLVILMGIYAESVKTRELLESMREDDVE